ncbi:hypothetical protein OAJ82_00100 [Alphaproteobacteria bacterium]|nr:hypothetical protein [Alphaproteobacteria bacterium]
MSNLIKIENSVMGECQLGFIITEIEVNHNRSSYNTFNLVDMAKEAGVDAVKFQTFIAEN